MSKNVKAAFARLWECYLDEFLHVETVTLLFLEVVAVERLFFKGLDCGNAI